MKKKMLLATAIAFLSMGTHVLAKTVTLDELQNSNAKYVPAVNVTSKEVKNGYWAYKSLANITRKYGLLIGEAGEKFDGSKPLTRNEAAVILVNLIGKVEQERINLDESEKTQIEILKNEFSDEITALTGRVATLEDNVNKLQGTVSKVQDDNKKTFKNVFGEDFKIGGSFQLRYNGIVEKGADKSAFPPNFSIPLADFRVSGKLAPHLNYFMQMNEQRTWGGGSSTTTSGGPLGDMYISTDIIPHNTIYVGQTRIPVGVEGTLSPTVLDTIDRSQISRNFSDYRDMGVKIAGNYPLIDYTIGAYNGSGMNYKDYSNDMGIGGMLIAKPLYKLPQYGKLELGGGYYRQNNGNTTNLATATRYESQTTSAVLAYKYKKYGLKGEWAYRDGYGSFKKVARGTFLETTYDLTPKIQLLARYDVFDPNKLARRDLSTEYTLGTNYFIAGNNIKIQLDGVAVNNQAGKDSKRIMVLTQYMF